MNIKNTLSKIAQQHPQALFKLNIKLAERGLPFYWEGGTKFNTSYRMFPAPRWVFKWEPPFIHLNEIYLTYFNSNEQVDIVYLVENDQIKTIKINGNQS